MRTRKPPSQSVLLRAVEARAAGNGWEAVAKLVKRSADTIRKWPHKYSDEWTGALRAAERRAVDEAANEGVAILRELLRSKSSKLRRQAASDLLQQRIELSKLEVKAAALLPPKPHSDAIRIMEYVEATPHEILCQIAANVLKTRLPRSCEAPALPASRAG